MLRNIQELLKKEESSLMTRKTNNLGKIDHLAEF